MFSSLVELALSAEVTLDVIREGTSKEGVISIILRIARQSESVEEYSVQGEVQRQEKEKRVGYESRVEATDIL